MKLGQSEEDFYAGPEYYSPGRMVRTENDIWSMGVIFYELLTLKKPFHNKDDILKGKYPKEDLELYDPDIQLIFHDIFKPEPKDRINSCELLVRIKHFYNFLIG